MNDKVREAVRDYLVSKAAAGRDYPFKKYLAEITDAEMEKIVWFCNGRADAETVHYAIESVVGQAGDPEITKEELKKELASGKTMNELFPFKPGQECEIFKAERFAPGDAIIYIPDTSLNGIPIDDPVTRTDAIEDIIGNCYTWYDFVDLCRGDTELAKEIFDYCDWQHPISALPEIDDEDEGEPDVGHKLHGHLRPWAERLCETVYDITLNAQHLCDYGVIEAEDSRGLFASILQWAVEFEREHPGPWDEGNYPGDYIDLIDEFARDKLTETYGKEP